MAKRKIEIQEPEVEVAQLIDLDETEKKPVWYRTGIWCTVAAIGGIAAAALYEIYRSGKESPAPAVDLFKAPVQPVVPHVEPVVEQTPVVESAPVEEAPEAPQEEGDYVGNSETLVFHTRECMFGERILDDKKVFLKNRDAAIAAGYKPCGRCKP